MWQKVIILVGKCVKWCFLIVVLHYCFIKNERFLVFQLEQTDIFRRVMEMINCGLKSPHLISEIRILKSCSTIFLKLPSLAYFDLYFSTTTKRKFVFGQLFVCCYKLLDNKFYTFGNLVYFPLNCATFVRKNVVVGSIHEKLARSSLPKPNSFSFFFWW